MPTLEIKKYPDPILRKKCKEVKEVTEEIKKLSQEMIEVMIKGQGIGLAAPQVGELKRIIAIQAEKSSVVFINPQVLKKSREHEFLEEGCLSFPGLWLKIKRPKKIEVEALTVDGKKIKIKAQGIFAQILQHEIDHLDGILFIDRISFWHRLRIKNKF